MPPFYYFTNSVIRHVLRRALPVTLTTSGLEHVPPTGPLLIVSNHLSNVDPTLIGAFIPRDVKMMSKAENFEGNWLLAWAARNYGAFPIRRGEGDIGAIRNALRVLKNGVLYMAPEGTRSTNAQMGEAQAGTVLLAHRSRVPLLPVGMSGQEKLASNLKRWRPTALHISIGPPFRLVSPERKPSRESLEAMSEAMMERIAAQVPPPYRGRFKGKLESPFIEELA